MRRSFELEKYEYMNKLPREINSPHSPPGKGESGVWAPAQTPLPHSPPGKGESGVWARPPTPQGEKLECLFLKKKLVWFFYLCYQTKHLCKVFSRKTFHLSH